jgi:hypothetical protein
MIRHMGKLAQRLASRAKRPLRVMSESASSWLDGDDRSTSNSFFYRGSDTPPDYRTQSKPVFMRLVEGDSDGWRAPVSYFLADLLNLLSAFASG